MQADPQATPPAPESEAPSRPHGIGLCLSGGGFRATLFHLGAIQRLAELGITARSDFASVASVSGGSLTATQWAIAEVQAQADGRGVDVARDISEPLRRLTAKDIRTSALAKTFLLPWNWFRGAYAVDAMVSIFEEAFGQGTLNLLPERPRFLFCATDMAFGASFVFERERVGSYLSGYAAPKVFTLAQAVAASACFPPLFGPLRIDRAVERFKGGRTPDLNADARRRVLADLRVTDGGVYDNMGLEPIWKNHRVVLVSDAGGLMDAEADSSFAWRIKRYQSIQEAQARGVRKRFLISGYRQGTIAGAYIGVGSSTARYAAARTAGYSKAFAMEVIANIRTDLDAFSEPERAVLINHGYTLMDAALRTHAPTLIITEAPFALPCPDFAAPLMSEEILRQRLKGSEKRKLTGRR